MSARLGAVGFCRQLLPTRPAKSRIVLSVTSRRSRVGGFRQIQPTGRAAPTWLCFVLSVCVHGVCVCLVCLSVCVCSFLLYSLKRPYCSNMGCIASVSSILAALSSRDSSTKVYAIFLVPSVPASQQKAGNNCLHISQSGQWFFLVWPLCLPHW